MCLLPQHTYVIGIWKLNNLGSACTVLPMLRVWFSPRPSWPKRSEPQAKISVNSDGCYVFSSWRFWANNELFEVGVLKADWSSEFIGDVMVGFFKAGFMLSKVIV